MIIRLQKRLRFKLCSIKTIFHLNGERPLIGQEKRRSGPFLVFENLFGSVSFYNLIYGWSNLKYNVISKGLRLLWKK